MSRIWVRGKREKPSPIIRVPTIGLEGWLEVELVDARTGLIKRRLGPYRNVITDDGLDGIGNGLRPNHDMTDFMAVGTGSTAPAVTDSTLESEVARTARNSSSANITQGANIEYYEIGPWTYEFAKSEANANLTELGLFSASSGGTMWARQLFVDAGGSPTTVTKTNSEILRVRYAYRVYVPQPDPIWSQSVDFDIRGTTVSTTVQTQPQGIDDDDFWASGGMIDGLGNWNPDMREVWQDNTPRTSGGSPVFTNRGPADTSTSDTLFGEDTKTVQGYTDGTFQRDVLYEIVANAANFGSGIGSIEYAMAISGFPGYPWISFFDPRIDKTSTDEISFTFRMSWGRH